MADKWVYNVIPFPEKSNFSGSGALIDELNKMGNDGWELVSIINHPDSEKFYFNAKTPFFAVLKKRMV
jgi:hypothetical protein